MSDFRAHENKQLMATLARLDGNPDFMRFRDIYLETLLAEYVDTCIESDTPARAQGAAQAVRRIKEDLEGAETAFYRLTNKAEIPLG